MARCPYCPFEVPDGDLHAEKAHMEAEHPEIIAQRMRESGFELRDGEWVDTLASEAD